MLAAHSNQSLMQSSSVSLDLVLESLDLKIEMHSKSYLIDHTFIYVPLPYNRPLTNNVIIQVLQRYVYHVTPHCKLSVCTNSLNL